MSLQCLVDSLFKVPNLDLVRDDLFVIRLKLLVELLDPLLVFLLVKRSFFLVDSCYRASTSNSVFGLFLLGILHGMHLLPGLVLGLLEASKLGPKCLQLDLFLLELDHLAFVLEFKRIQINKQACILLCFLLNVLLRSVFVLGRCQSSLSYRLLCVS